VSLSTLTAARQQLLEARGVVDQFPLALAGDPLLCLGQQQLLKLARRSPAFSSAA